MEWTADQIITAVKTHIGGTVADADALLMLQAGLMDVLGGLDPRRNPPVAHNWSFLQPIAAMTFYAETTGTMTVTSGTTVTDAVNTPFCQQMIGATLIADTSETEYTITAYTSTSVVTVGATATADTGDTFTITPNGVYNPPTLFGGLLDPLVYAYNASYRPKLLESDPETIFAMWRNSESTGYTYRYAIVPAANTTSAAQGWKFVVAPVPSEDMLLKCRHVLELADIAAGQKLPGGRRFTVAVRSAALAAVDATYSHTTGGRWADIAQRDMIAAIDADKALFTTSNDTDRMLKG